MNIKSIGRNDPCPCGSGKKYKQCCQNKVDVSPDNNKKKLLESIPELFIQARQATLNKNLVEAEKLYLQILNINPKHVITLNNLGLLKQDLGQYEDAISYLQKVIKLEATAEYHTNLARAFIANNNNEEAVFHLKTAVQLNPGDYLANNNLGLLLCNLNNYQEGLPYLYKATQLNPKDYLSFFNLGVLLLKQGKYQEASIFYRKAISTNPEKVDPYQNLLFCLCFEKDAFPDKYLSAAQELDRFYQTRIKPYTHWDCSPPSTSTLKIGIVSGDLRNHAVSYFLEGVVSQLNKNTLQLFAYNTNPNEDSLTEKLKPHFKQWHNIGLLPVKASAAQIYQDQIDILIDLSGYTLHNGLNVFAFKPAPIQISWLGYFASTGLRFMDYFIADPISVPKDKQHYFSEKIVYLPETRLCFTPLDDEAAPEVNRLPALINGYVTFGCFQNLSKINDDALILWAEILSHCPNSRLMIKNGQIDNPFIKKDFLQRAIKAGLEADRLILEGASDRYAYFKSYHNVDFMLDTFPYPGGTTTCEALWMGVPTLTLSGETLLERQGHALLTAAGLSEWICFNKAEYVQKAISFTQALNTLSDNRLLLRQRVKVSPLMNTEKFATNFEKTLFDIWQTHKNII